MCIKSKWVFFLSIEVSIDFLVVTTSMNSNNIHKCKYEIIPYNYYDLEWKIKLIIICFVSFRFVDVVVIIYLNVDVLAWISE